MTARDPLDEPHQALTFPTSSDLRGEGDAYQICGALTQSIHETRPVRITFQKFTGENQ